MTLGNLMGKIIVATFRLTATATATHFTVQLQQTLWWISDFMGDPASRHCDPGSRHCDPASRRCTSSQTSKKI